MIWTMFPHRIAKYYCQFFGNRCFWGRKKVAFCSLKIPSTVFSVKFKTCIYAENIVGNR